MDISQQATDFSIFDKYFNSEAGTKMTVNIPYFVLCNFDGLTWLATSIEETFSDILSDH